MTWGAGPGTNAEPRLALPAPEPVPGNSVDAATEVSAFLPGPGTEMAVFESKLRDFSRSGQLDPQLFLLLLALPPADYPQAWELVNQVGFHSQKHSLRQALVRAWSKKDPRTALAAVLTFSDPVMREELSREVLQVWSETEADAALAWIHQLPAGQRREQATAAVIYGLGRRDPAAAARLLAELPAGEARRSVIGWLSTHLAGVDPDAAATLLTEVDPLWRNEVTLPRLAETKAAKSVPDALAWAESLSNSEEREAALKGIVSYLARREPEQAIELVMGRTEAKERNQLTATLVSGWASIDVKAASRWVSQLADETLRWQAWSGLLLHWASRDPEAAANFALGLFPEGATSAAALKDIARLWGYFDWGAMEWANQLPAGPDRDAFVAAVCPALAFQDPIEAGRLAASMSPGKEQVEVVKEVLSSWCRFSEASEAAAWAVTLPEAARVAAVVEVAGSWGAKDPAACAEWLLSLPGDEARAKAAECFVERAATRRPDLAAQWVGAIADPEKRSAQITSIARHWLQSDPVAAEAWLQQMPVHRRATTGDRPVRMNCRLTNGSQLTPERLRICFPFSVALI